MFFYPPVPSLLFNLQPQPGAPSPLTASLLSQARPTTQQFSQQCPQNGAQEMTTHQPTHSLWLASKHGEFQSIPMTDVSGVHFEPEGGMENFYLSVSAKDQDARALLSQIDFQNPLTTEAKPGAIITGTLTVMYSGANNEQESRTFKLLGATLLQDTNHPNVYYHASSGLQSCLEKQ